MEAQSSMFRLHSTLLAKLGISHVTMQYGKWTVKTWLHIMWIICGLLNIYFTLMAMLLDIFFNTKDLLEFAYKISAFLIDVDTTFKYSYMLFKRNKFLDLMDTLDSFSWEGFPTRNLDTGEFTSFHYVNLMDSYTTRYMLVSLLLLPVIILVTLTKGGNNFIYNCWYPFDTSFGYSFDLMYISQLFASYIYLFTACLFNTFYVKLVLMVCSQFEALKASLQVLKPQTQETYHLNLSLKQLSGDTEELQKLVGVDQWNEVESLQYQNQSKFNKCIKHHQELLRFIKYMQHVYSTIFFVQFLNAAVVLCFSLFLTLTVVKFDAEYLITCVILSNMITQMFVYCWFGTKLTETAESVRQAAYDCSWYDATHSFKKCILIIMIQCDHKIFLTAKNFATVSLSTLVSILQEAISYMAVMQTLTASSSHHTEESNVTLHNEHFSGHKMM